MLSRFLHELANDIRVDLSNDEISEVRSAVFEMVTRISTQLENETPYFRSAGM